MAIFLDTSFLIALVIESDQLHRRALAWRTAIREPLITSEFVLLEVADSLSKPSRRAFATDIFDAIREDPSVSTLSLDTRWLNQGFNLFSQRPDQEWGLTDCISFEIMRELHIQDALTFDHHFEPAGFRALLRTDAPSS